ncbi:hypothetical protein D6D10_10376 [Aureobasidium pullulans]|uniref:Uncharacterized protein n=1 Tax=Aureobasidium pullulans TaxID=5580 RepID=A0A4S9DQ46_AURPU|nr:hypothetical protein D6D10_10376 [Aureobasidium pullulans]
MTRYVMNRYLRRWVANTFGPPLLTLTYSLIVRYYLCVLPVNGVIDPPLISAGFVFYAWLIFSIFALDWAKSALAGFEAWALMDPRFAPPTALHLMWHTDRAWGSVSGWRSAILPLCMDIRYRFSKRPARQIARGPAGLWWFLAFSSFVFYAAIPLSSLSMEMESCFKRSARKIIIVGPSETTFDAGISNVVAEQANNRWRLGNPTTPYGKTIFYSPDGVGQGSSEYYEEKIRSSWQASTSINTVPAAEITFFFGPKVYERVYGNVWGLLTSLKCSILSPADQNFTLLKVHEIDNWTAPGLNSSDYGTELSKQRAGLNLSLFNDGTSFGVSYAYLIASDLTTSNGSDYTDISAFPTNGSLEIVLWQACKGHHVPDPVFGGLPSHPAVVSSVWAGQNTTYLGFGLRCSVNSSTGTASLHAARMSYSNFTPKASIPPKPSPVGSGNLNIYPGMKALQSIVFASFTTAVLNAQAPLTCANSDSLSSVTCNPWYGINAAIGSGLDILPTNDTIPHTQIPVISPKGLKLAIEKLFGEATIAMMSQGIFGWETDLYGLDSTTALVPGKVPWSIVLTLLILWTAVTSISSLWVFGRKRWADTLSGFDMFRFGAEWKEAVWQFEENEFEKCPILLEVPGMIGDMESNVMNTGFIGLSKDEAKKNGSFVFARDAII